MRRRLFRPCSSWSIARIRRWRSGSSCVTISSASSSPRCPKCVVLSQTRAACSLSDSWCANIDVVFCLRQEFQEQIKAVSFKDVVVCGRELSGALITALINVYIKDSACVDTVSAHLRDICPLLYSCDDSICSKVPALLNETEDKKITGSCGTGISVLFIWFSFFVVGV